MLTIYNASFQTFIVKKYLNYLSKELNTTITVESVDISFLNKITIKNLYVQDLNEDTLANIKEITVNLSVSLSTKYIGLKNVKLNQPYFNLQHQKDSVHNNLFFIIDYFSSEDTTSTKSNWQVKLNQVKITKGHFVYDNFNYDEQLAVIDYNHVDISYLTTVLNDVEFLSDGVACGIEQLKFHEKRGFQLDNLVTQFKISGKGIEAEQLVLKTPNSLINGSIVFATDSFSNLANFITEVKITSSFDSSLVSFRDICHFASALDCLDKSVIFNGEVKGTLAGMKGRKLEITTDDGTYFKGNADISGIPNPDDLFLYITIKELNTSKEKLEQIPLYPFVKETFIKLPKNINHLGNMNFKGTLSGFIHDFVAYGTLKTDLGIINTDISLKFKEDNTYYQGKVRTKRFYLGKFLEIPSQIGTIALNSEVKGSGFSIEDINATLTGNIEHIIIRDYEYSHINVDGNFKNQIFSGKLAVEDENIVFDFDGAVDLSKKIPEFKFIANIKEAKLGKLNLVKTKEKMQTRFSTILMANMKGNNIDNIEGEIQLKNSTYIDKIDSIFIPSTQLTSYIENDIKKLSVNADFANINIEGNYQINDFVAVINNIIYTYLPSQNNQIYLTQNITNNFSFDATIYNTDILTKLFFNNIRFSPNTQLNGLYNSSENKLSINGNADKIEVFGTILKNFSFIGNATNESLNIESKISDVYIFGLDSLHLEAFELTSMMKNDSLSTNFHWKKDTSDLSGSGFITNIIHFQPKLIKSQFLNSYIVLNDTVWNISPNNLIVLDSSSISISNFKLSNETQKLLIDGIIDDNNTNNQLDVYFEKFNLSLFKKLIPKDVVQIDGIFNGVASIKKVNNDFLFTSDLKINQLKINDYLIGEGDIKSRWNSEDEFLSLDSKFYIDRIPSILLVGKYYPKKEANNINFTLTLNQTELSIFDTYVNDFVSDLSGKANASISIKGNLKQPELKGKINLTETKFTVNYLKTTYSFPTLPINVVSDMISFDHVTLFDEKKNKAHTSGTLLHSNFKNFNLDLGVQFKEFMVLNTKQVDNGDFFGRAFGTGHVDIAYDQQHSKTNIDVSLKTTKGTVFSIPLGGGEEIQENSFVSFVTKDSSSLIINKEEKLDLSKIDMQFDLDVTDAAEVRLIFDEKVGDIMKSTGNGNLKLEINTEGDFNIFGTYIIKSGDYLFTLQNVINKRFNLLEGGSIKWNGNPLDAIIDISATYRTRARLFDLLMAIDTSDVLKKRIPVDLTLRLRNSLLTPEISFDISLPTADEDTKSKVKSVLYVSNQEENIQELNKQVFSLLVLNRFLPPPGVDGVAGNAGLEKTATSELLSNQLSNWLSKISNEFDIGVNYRPGDEISSQELELALSTQLFNDRLVIDSNFGLSDRQNSPTGQNNNNLIGDVTLEYKISKDGKLRVKAFNKSNQFSLLEINSPYTQGVGISYKEEFDTFGELVDSFFSLFKRKSKKQKNVDDDDLDGL